MMDIDCDYYSMEDIAREWPAEEGEKDNSTDLETSLRKKFTYILKNKLELSQEEIGWFKERLNGGEQFIFQAGKRAPLYLKQILDICGRRNAEITPGEEHILIENFARIIPYPILKDDIPVCNDAFNARAYRIEQAVRELYRRSQVDNLYMNRLFVTIDAKLELNKEKRRKFYRNQYEWIKNWKEKWIFAMEKADGIRKAERVECLYICKKRSTSGITKEDEVNFCETGKSDNEMLQRAYSEMKKICSKDLCQYVVWLFKTKYLEKKEKESKKGMEDVKTREGCIDACTMLFSEVITYCLKESSAEDFEYMVKEAIKELEIINTILMQDYKADKRRQESLYPEIEILRHKDKIKICTDEDLQNLSNIRRHLNEVENEKIVISDYMK